MNRITRKRMLNFKCILIILGIIAFVNSAFAQQFKVSYADSIYNKPFTGHVLLYLSKDKKTPKEGEAGIELFPCFSVYVKNVKPGSSVIFDDKATSYPALLSDMERGEYYVQAVWDRNLGGRSIAESPGNLYSVTQKVNITKDYKKVFNLVATKIVPEPTFKETPYVKQLKAPSALLSNFLKRPVTINAAVVLPKEYFTDTNRKFPVLYQVSGYGGDYHRYSGWPNPSTPIDTTAVIMVYLDGNCSLGHSVYANSNNNGPWGDALTTEAIPLIEKTYRCNGARLLTGHSSGGWTVLWLQTHYPKVFDGCWSSSPDPVDFRSFQKVNLYKHENMFYGKDSTLNQTGTVAGYFPWFDMKDCYRMEHVIYRGEQMHSFDAVFSPKGADGEPERICNFETGEIDTNVFSHWKNYDISLYLRTNWDQVKSDLDGKVRVTVGKQDNFLLNYAVVMLEGEMKKLNSQFVFKYYPGDHFTVATPEFWKDGYTFLEKKYNDWLAKNQPATHN
ncbi:alpha/beta hydrolase-fold protein [Mucilaginibacter sp.]